MKKSDHATNFNLSKIKRKIKKSNKRLHGIRHMVQNNSKNNSVMLDLSLKNLRSLIKKPSPHKQNKIYKIIKNYDTHALIKKTTTYDFTVYLRDSASKKFNKTEIKRMIKLIIQIIRKIDKNHMNNDNIKTLLDNKGLAKYLKKYRVLVIKNSNTKVIPYKMNKN